MDVYLMFLKLLVSTIITFIEAAMMLFAAAPADRAVAPRATPRLVRAAAERRVTTNLQSLTAQLASTDPSERTKAACALADMDAAAAPAAPALAKLLGDPTRVAAGVCDERRRNRHDDDTTTPGESAAAALASIGAPALELVIAAACSPEWFVRKNAVWALGAIDDARAVPTVIAALRDSDAAVRRNAAWALGALDAKAAVPALIDGLKDSDPETRATAAWALGAIGEPQAAEALATALKDRDVEVRRRAVWALGAIQR